MNLQTILKTKGSQVHTIAPESTLADVVKTLVEKNCGSLVVVDKGEMVGIITERDILRACADSTNSLESRTVERTMTTDVITGHLTDEVEAIMGLMTKKRIRHLPILADGNLAGLISIGDIVKAQHDQLSMENHYLKNYIHS
jgi:CBS domain-containing protein